MRHTYVLLSEQDKRMRTGSTSFFGGIGEKKKLERH